MLQLGRYDAKASFLGYNDQDRLLQASVNQEYNTPMLFRTTKSSSEGYDMKAHLAFTFGRMTTYSIPDSTMLMATSRCRFVLRAGSKLAGHKPASPFDGDLSG